MCKFISIFVATILFSNFAWADGNDLLKQCSLVRIEIKDLKVEDYSNIGKCLGLMQGVTNTNSYYQFIAKQNTLFCTPEYGLKNGQAARVVVKYLEEHPEKLHLDDVLLTMLALREAFPCKSQ
jgi:hypothetical protein